MQSFGYNNPLLYSELKNADKKGHFCIWERCSYSYSRYLSFFNWALMGYSWCVCLSIYSPICPFNVCLVTKCLLDLSPFVWGQVLFCSDPSNITLLKDKETKTYCNACICCNAMVWFWNIPSGTMVWMHGHQEVPLVMYVYGLALS